MGFVEVRAPEQFKFSTPGQKIQGVLVSMASHTVKGKKVLQYTVRKENGDRVTFLATWDLARKIERRALGHPIYVEFVGDHDSIESNGNKAKVFRVMVDDDTKAEQVADEVEITDDDVPF
jgi:hypothetical protein